MHEDAATAANPYAVMRNTAAQNSRPFKFLSPEEIAFCRATLNAITSPSEETVTRKSDPIRMSLASSEKPRSDRRNSVAARSLPRIQLPEHDVLSALQNARLWQKGQPLRLHLGCGEQHFAGYVNLDYPPDNHNVMNVRADAYANILDLKFPAGSVDEVRLHHVFEHFNRVTALAMLIKWHGWLKEGGRLRLETPDLVGSAKILASSSPLNLKMAASRHLAGDQAASWAYHLDHWFPERYEHTLRKLAFDQIEIKSSIWPHSPFLANVEVIATKNRSLSPAQLLEAADALLWDSTIAESERPTFEVWRKQLRAILAGDTAAMPCNVPSATAPATNPILAALSHNASKLPRHEIQDFNQRNRDRWVAAQAATVAPGSRVLDVGAGTCPYRQLFAHCEYRTHDFKKYEGVKLGNTSEYGQIDYESEITKIPVPDQSFEVILCTEVLEHVPEPIAAIQEMLRILKPGGRLLLSAPLGSGLHQLPFHFYGGYTPEWYRYVAAKFGAQVNEITPNGGYFKLLAQECGRLAWTMDQHRALHGANAELIGSLFGEWLPRYLFGLEEKQRIDQFTVGYHVTMVKNAAPSQKPPDQAPASAAESKLRKVVDKQQGGLSGQRSASGRSEKKFKAVSLVFSKDRPLQLDAALRSWKRHCRDAGSAAVIVLYKASTSKLLSLYQRLAREHPEVNFVQEGDFRRDVLRSVRGQEYVLFVVDDTVFVQDFAMADVVRTLEEHPEVLGFSLRLGRNTTYCYTLNQPQRLPEFEPQEPGSLKYRWPNADYDFGYPLEVSSSMYRGKEILPLLEQLDFKNPNTLEDILSRGKERFRESHPFLACWEHSGAFSIPANKVQLVCNNRASSHAGYSAEALAELFAQGQRIQTPFFDGFIPNACHQEVELKTAPTAKSAPLLSVIIPCYKQAHFLTEAIESVVAQTFSDWEIIIVNDGSPDNTSEVARQLIAKYPGKEIRLLEKPNGGLPGARNAGIRASQGKYLLPLDADDKIKPTLLAKLVPILDKQPKVGFAYTHIQHFGALQTEFPLPDFDRATLVNKDNIACVCALVRRSAWAQVGGYNEAMREGYEDWDFWVGCVEQGWDGYCLHEPLFLYRKSGQTMLSQANHQRSNNEPS